VQIALDPIRQNPDDWKTVEEAAKRGEIKFVSGMFGTKGEDYTSMETIRRTGGLVPDETWEENYANSKENAKIAKRLGLTLVTFHAGFLPHDEADPKFAVLIDRIQKVADVFAAEGIHLGFETGQETAETLNFFLEKLQRSNVGVNFDPANMLIYNMDDPTSSLKALLPQVKQCHIKDASRPTVAGGKGKEELAGTGEVDWQAFFRTLQEADFRGALVIEREKGDQRVEDVRTAIELVKRHG